MADDVRDALQAALGKLNAQKDQIERQIAALSIALRTLGRRVRPSSDGRPRRRMSPAERRAVGLRMKAYWAKRRKVAKSTK